MYNTASVLLVVGFLTITGYGKPVAEPEAIADDTTTEDEKLNACAGDVIRLISQQEKTHQVDFSSLSEGCMELVNGAMQYVKEMGDSSSSSDQTEKTKRGENEDGSGDGTVSPPGPQLSFGEWKETVDNVLYHLLKALEFEHDKLQKTLKWVGEIQDNQNIIANGKFPALEPAESEEDGGNRNKERKRTEADSKESPAERMKHFYNDLTPGELRGLMKNKPQAFDPTWNDNQEQQELGNELADKIQDNEEEGKEDSASETPEEEGKQDDSQGEASAKYTLDEEENLEEREIENDSASETPAEQTEKDGLDRDDSASETPAEEAIEGDSASETPADEAEGGETDMEDSASETPAEVETEESESETEDSASETPAEVETEEGEAETEDSASETPAEEAKEGGADTEDSASETPADEAEGDETDMEDSASETPAEVETEEDEAETEDSASETPAEEAEEDSASETPAEEAEEDGADTEDSASETPADKAEENDSASETPADKTKDGVNQEDSASETQAEEDDETPAENTEDNGVDREDSASETPEEDNNEINRYNFGSKTPQNERLNNVGNALLTKHARQRLTQHNHLENSQDGMIRKGNNELYEVKREPEVVLGDEQENNQETDSSVSGISDEEKQQLKDKIVNELKDLPKGGFEESDRMRQVVNALKTLSRQTQADETR